LANPVEFAEIYLEALRAQMLHLQGDYRKRKRAFDTLFKHCKYDPKGSFAYRWERILRRLDQASVDDAVTAIRQKSNSRASANPPSRKSPFPKVPDRSVAGPDHSNARTPIVPACYGFVTFPTHNRHTGLSEFAF